jgi:hypothetical protein
MSTLLKLHLNTQCNASILHVNLRLLVAGTGGVWQLLGKHECARGWLWLIRDNLSVSNCTCTEQVAALQDEAERGAEQRSYLSKASVLHAG